MLKNTLPIFLTSLLCTFAAHAAETNTPTPKESKDMKPTIIEEDIVTLTTDDGVIVIKLDSVNCPKHSENFKKLVKEGFYDGTTFHRVIPGFMIQGGDPLGNGTGGPGYRFADEFHPELNFDRPYLLAMANSGPGTNGSQFFITVAETSWLNRKHTIFGEVKDEASKKIVDAIGTVKTGGQDRPVQAVKINSVTITE
jgi:peptidyl-prolyl cis-trans isomerase A (cyclophilin A)